LHVSKAALTGLNLARIAEAGLNPAPAFRTYVTKPSLCYGLVAMARALFELPMPKVAHRASRLYAAVIVALFMRIIYCIIKIPYHSVRAVDWPGSHRGCRRVYGI
jgi:hypothetical protein